MAVQGFFSGSTLAKSKRPDPTTAQCGACGLLKRCESPKLPVAGYGGQGVLIVGDRPLGIEDKAGAFVGGNLSHHIEGLGLELYRDCWYTAATICHSKKTTPAQVGYCRPNLKQTIKRLKPRVILTCGQAALRAVLGWTWRPDPGSVKQWAGQIIPDRKLNAWVCPTYDPGWVEDEQHACLERYYDRHLDAAFDLEGRPYDKPPADFVAQVKRCYDPAEAAAIMHKMIEAGGPVAFDYETNMLKPEWPEARIVSAAVCWRGKRTVAFPWAGEAIKAFSSLLRSPLPKIAANIMFEDRWTRSRLGHGVRNWVFDTMQASHLIDNQPGINSVGYQSYALLGVPDHEHHIKPFLKSKTGSRENRIDEIDLADLLLYNGLDAVHEYWIAGRQMAQIGIEPPEDF